MLYTKHIRMYSLFTMRMCVCWSRWIPRIQFIVDVDDILVGKTVVEYKCNTFSEVHDGYKHV